MPRVMCPVNRKTAVVRSTGSYSASRIMRAGFSCVAASISQVGLQVLRFLLCDQMRVAKPQGEDALSGCAAEGSLTIDGTYRGKRVSSAGLGGVRIKEPLR